MTLLHTVNQTNKDGPTQETGVSRPLLEQSHDMIIIGGGIQGVMIALEAAGRGLHPLLLERGDIGAGTSANWYRILHGGLRYLQTLDLFRHRISVKERSWFLREFPGLVRPAEFLMPLYGRGLKRPSAFRLAFMADAALGFDRNKGIAGSAHLARGRVLNAADTIAAFPAVVRDGLQGGAVWQDAIVPDTRALFDALTGRARAKGALIMPGIAVEEIRTGKERALGVRARDEETGQSIAFKAPVIIDASGASAGRLATGSASQTAELPCPQCLAFNLVLDRPPPSTIGVSVTPPGKSGPMLFVYPLAGRSYLGTWYEPWTAAASAPNQRPEPSRTAIDRFLSAVNQAIPGFNATADQISKIQAGLLPVTAAGTTQLRDAPMIVDHAARNGAAGLYSVSGVKFTTARQVAVTVLDKIGKAAATTA